MLSDILDNLTISYDENNKYFQFWIFLVCWGETSITPTEANTPTLKQVNFPKAFKSPPAAVVTPLSTVPGTKVTGVGVSSKTIDYMSLVVTRTNTTATTIEWIAIGFGT